MASSTIKCMDISGSAFDPSNAHGTNISSSLPYTITDDFGYIYYAIATGAQAYSGGAIYVNGLAIDELVAITANGSKYSKGGTHQVKKGDVISKITNGDGASTVILLARN